jgi:hypothetical protein
MTTGATDARSRRRSRVRRPGSATKADHHDDAVLQAEVRRLVHALCPFGVLRRDALKREACSASWHEGGFERALEAAIRAGRIERLPFEFYRLSSSKTPATAGERPSPPDA